MQKFGDNNTDNAAKHKLAKVFPEHHIEQISIDGIAKWRWKYSLYYTATA